MQPPRSAKRVKNLCIDPIGHDMVHFRSSLEDYSESTDGTEVIHSLAIDGTISLPDLTIRSIEPHSYHQPYRECEASLEPVRKLVGLTISPGFRTRVQSLIGGTAGCTHFLSLALDLATVHTLALFLRIRAESTSGDDGLKDAAWMRIGLSLEPRLENACIALTSDSSLVKKAKRKLDT